MNNEELYKKFRCNEIFIYYNPKTKIDKTKRCKNRFNRASINVKGHKICSSCAELYTIYGVPGKDY